jgi:hypothetical protein
VELGHKSEAEQWALDELCDGFAGRSARWVKVKNPKAPAEKREAEEDWGR